MGIKTIRINELLHLINKPGIIIFDVRNREEYRRSHFKNAINLHNSDEIVMYLRNKRAREIIVYCDRGVKSMQIVKEINNKGYNARSLIGGYNSYLSLKH